MFKKTFKILKTKKYWEFYLERFLVGVDEHMGLEVALRD
jgi:hypothetical protein